MEQSTLANSAPMERIRNNKLTISVAVRRLKPHRDQRSAKLTDLTIIGSETRADLCSYFHSLNLDTPTWIAVALIYIALQRAEDLERQNSWGEYDLKLLETRQICTKSGHTKLEMGAMEGECESVLTYSLKLREVVGRR